MGGTLGTLLVARLGTAHGSAGIIVIPARSAMPRSRFRQFGIRWWRDVGGGRGTMFGYCTGGTFGTLLVARLGIAHGAAGVIVIPARAAMPRYRFRQFGFGW